MVWLPIAFHIVFVQLCFLWNRNGGAKLAWTRSRHLQREFRRHRVCPSRTARGGIFLPARRLRRRTTHHRPLGSSSGGIGGLSRRRRGTRWTVLPLQSSGLTKIMCTLKSSLILAITTEAKFKKSHFLFILLSVFFSNACFIVNAIFLCSFYFLIL